MSGAMRIPTRWKGFSASFKLGMKGVYRQRQAVERVKKVTRVQQPDFHGMMESRKPDAQQAAQSEGKKQEGQGADSAEG